MASARPLDEPRDMHHSTHTVNGKGRNATPAPEVTREQLVDLYRIMATAREVDRVEMELAGAGEAFFQISGVGHEPAAVFNLFLQNTDWVHAHYRDKALLIARGIEPQAWFDSLLTNASNYSQGRQMACFMASREHRVPSTVIPVANHCLQAVGIASHIREDEGQPIVLCGIGDGGTQQGEFLEAVAEAVRDQLPVLFYIEDNAVAISTKTAGRTFFDRPDGPASDFMGLEIHRFDGRRIAPEAPRIGRLIQHVRQQRQPGLCLLRVERLASHSNADDQRVYRTQGVLDQLRQEGDGLHQLRLHLLTAGVQDAALDTLDTEVRDTVRAAAERARRIGDPVPCLTAKADFNPPDTLRGIDPATASAPREPRHGEARTMLESMRVVLSEALERDARMTLSGQDIEDPKGDVFGLTKGLSTHFGKRVRNASLSESTIIGRAIGEAMAGARPVVFIQFADFLPNGINQVLSELGSIWWRTAGEFDCPVKIMITCGGYRPGLGPFHSQTMEAILAHTPGIDVVMPSAADDAAGLLRTVLASPRPTVFLYPKVCLNDRHPESVCTHDPTELCVPLGKARRVREGNDLTLVTWGSTVSIGRDVADEIARQTDRRVDLWDLRSIDPWDREAIVASAQNTGRLLVLHEDNRTAGFGAEVLATVAEDLSGQGVVMRRLTRPDTYLPCNFPNQLDILPSFRRTLAEACDLLELHVRYELAAQDLDGTTIVEAPAPSPADQAVTLAIWRVEVGQTVEAGDPLVDVEADKAAHEVVAQAPGVVEALLLEEGVTVPVGTPLLRLRPTTTQPGDAVVRRINREDKGSPVLTDPAKPASGSKRHAPAPRTAADRNILVLLSPIEIAEGRDRLTNTALENRFPGRSGADIVKRTGIESRPLLSAQQSALTLAVDAARRALQSQNLNVDQLTGIVCHTTTPPANTPSMACMLLNELDPTSEHECMVYDVNAACSGWLYAIDTAYHTVLTRPESCVLVVTTEALSRVVDPQDFDTAILFGDAATATIMRGHTGSEADLPTSTPDARSLILRQPTLSGKADPQGILTVGFQGQAPIRMDGQKVFIEGVRAMTKMTHRAFELSGMNLEDLDWLVPHQANRRIFEAVRKRLRVPPEKVIDLIGDHGNTSSSSIPLAISKTAHTWKPGDLVGVCAFGGGFTFGAAVLRVV